jgi:hypothetical protein
MRGGVDSKDLLTDTDVEDLQILGKIIQENIEVSKNTKMPMV